MPQRCIASFRDTEVSPIRVMCQESRHHAPPHRSEDGTRIITWKDGDDRMTVTVKGEDPMALEPYSPQERSDLHAANSELQSEFERLREVALKAAAHLRHIPAMPDDIEIAEELEAAAEGG